MKKKRLCKRFSAANRCMFIVHQELDTFGRRIKFLRIAWIAPDKQKEILAEAKVPPKLLPFHREVKEPSYSLNVLGRKHNKNYL